MSVQHQRLRCLVHPLRRVLRLSGHLFCRSRSMRYPLLALILAVAPGCDVDVDGCETFIYSGPAIVVGVRDAETGASLSSGVSVTAQTDGHSEQLTLVQTQPPQFEGVTVAVDRPRVRPGTYTVTVAADGYEQGTALAEVVADDFCVSSLPIPSQPVRLEIALTPSVP